MLSTVKKFARDSVRSRFAWLLVCLHAAWFLLAIANMSPPAPSFAKFLDSGGWSSATVFAGRPFHFTYESVFLKALLVVDTPSMLVGIPLGFLSAPIERVLHVGFFVGSYVDAVALLLVGTCQWLVVGNLIDIRLKSHPFWARALPGLNRFFVIVMMLVLLFAVIAIPIVHNRSQRLGLRHPAISFHLP